MRTATVVSLVCMVAALSGCSAGGMSASGSGQNVAFVASNSDSVLLDFAARPPGQLASANETATQQCQIFSRSTAVLESLNVRDPDTIRATYLCRNGTQTVWLQHRQ
jgi:hypothetical protein